MKKTNLILILMLLPLLFSCTKDSSSLDLNEIIIGSWKYKKVTFSKAIDFNGDDIKGTDIDELPDCRKDDFLNFTKDLEEQTFILSNNRLKCNDSEKDIIQKDSYYINMEQTKILFNDSTKFYNVIDFSKDKLIISQKDTFKGIDIIVTIYLIRI